jgi:dolichyl-phosphate-mannose--protein O-mannosyl transferase
LGNLSTPIAVPACAFSLFTPSPHAKLLLAASTKLGGCDGTFSFKKIGDDYKNIPVYALRIVHALAGTMLNLLFFIPLNQFGVSRPPTRRMRTAGCTGVF